MGSNVLEVAHMGNFVLGIIGNTLMFLFLRQSLRNSNASNFSWTFTLLNLTIANLVTSFSGIIATYTNYSIDVHPNGPWGDILCKLFTSYSVTWMCTNVSVMHLCVLTWERYAIVTRDTRRMRRNNNRNTRVLSAVVWFTGILLFLPYVPFQYVEKGICVERFPSYGFHVAVVWADAIFFFFLPVVFFIASYRGIIRVLRKSRRIIGPLEFHDRTRRVVTKTTMFLLILFVVCWGPSYVLYTLQTMSQHLAEKLALVVDYSFFIALISHTLQPVIFAYNSRPFRLNVIGKLVLLKDFCCCTGFSIEEFSFAESSKSSDGDKIRLRRHQSGDGVCPMNGVVHFHCNNLNRPFDVVSAGAVLTQPSTIDSDEKPQENV